MYLHRVGATVTACIVQGLVVSRLKVWACCGAVGHRVCSADSFCLPGCRLVGSGYWALSRAQVRHVCMQACWQVVQLLSRAWRRMRRLCWSWWRTSTWLWRLPGISKRLMCQVCVVMAEWRAVGQAAGDSRQLTCQAGTCLQSAGS